MSPFRLIVCALLASSVQLGAFDSVANDAVRQSPAGRASIVGPGMEANTNRSGSDYDGFDTAAPEQCQAACAKDGRCRAWTWVVPGVQTPRGKCWLKHAVPAPMPNQNCCISGLSGHAPAPVAKPVPHGSANPPASASPSLAKPVPYGLAKPPASASPSSRQSILATAEVSPQSVNFGRMWGGDVHQRPVTVTPPASALRGNVRIELEPSKVFSIAEIRVLGNFAAGSPVNTSNQGISPGGQARLTVDRTRARIEGGAPLFDVEVWQGEAIVVTVRASPVMDQLKSGAFDGSGPYHSALRLQGQGWQALIPVSVGVEGQRLGVVAHVDSPRHPICQPAAYVPGVGEQRSVQITLSNRQGRGSEGRVEFADLAEGFQKDPAAASRTFKLAAGQSTTLELPMVLFWKDVRLPTSGPDGSAAAATYANGVKIFDGGWSTVTLFDVTVLPSQRIYHLKGEDGLKWSVDWGILCDGRWNASWHVFNPNLAVRRSYMLDILWRGMRLARLSGYVGRVQNDSRTYSPEPIPSNPVKSDYAAMLLEPPTARLSYENLP